jgi:hypothetical protein
VLLTPPIPPGDGAGEPLPPLIPAVAVIATIDKEQSKALTSGFNLKLADGFSSIR